MTTTTIAKARARLVRDKSQEHFVKQNAAGFVGSGVFDENNGLLTAYGINGSTSALEVMVIDLIAAIVEREYKKPECVKCKPAADRLQAALNFLAPLDDQNTSGRVH